MVTLERTAQDWYQEAARCYLENHQGCAWCGGAHRVYLLVQDQQVVYYCYGCDFRTGFDKKVGNYFSFPGEAIDTRAGRKTMIET